MGVMIGIVSIVLALLVIALSLRPTLYFCLHGGVGGPALETVVNARGRIFGRNNDSVMFQFRPTPETSDMLKEIGACIYDVKTLGDAAIEKWR